MVKYDKHWSKADEEKFQKKCEKNRERLRKAIKNCLENDVMLTKTQAYDMAYTIMSLVASSD